MNNLIENVKIESVRADYVKKRVAISLSVSLLQLEPEVRNQLAEYAAKDKLVSIDFDAMPETQGKMKL